MLEVSGLSVAREGKRILDHVSLSVFAGEIVAVLGEVGCGKSMLFRAIMALEPIEPGQIRLFGKDLARLEGREMMEVRRLVGAAYQGGALISALSVAENVMLPLVELAHLDPETVRIVSRMKLQQLGILEVADRMPATLSQGMCQRAAIARAIAADPKLLLCDGVFAGLDRSSREIMVTTLRKLREFSRMTIVVFTAYAEVAAALADRICVLSDGRIVAEGKPEEILTSDLPAVRRLIHGERLAEEPDQWQVLERMVERRR